MKLTQEILDLAAQVAKAHKLAEVFYTEKGEFFSSAREARNNKAKAVRAFPAPSLKEKVSEVLVEVITSALGQTLDEQNGHTAGSEHLTVTITEDAKQIEPLGEAAKVEPAKAKAVAPKPIMPVKAPVVTPDAKQVEPSGEAAKVAVEAAKPTGEAAKVESTALVPEAPQEPTV